MKSVDLQGGILEAGFGALGSLEVHEDEVWQICAYDNFCSTTRDLSTLKVSKIFVRPFVRNPGKGGGPLKGTPPLSQAKKNFFSIFFLFYIKVYQGPL